jgi:hypothetical protein
MSYCRWSCDDFSSDLYCYEPEGGGYLTEVATKRIVFAEPLPPAVPFDSQHLERWTARHKVVMNIVGRSQRVPIGLPHDGETFFDESLLDFENRLLTLRALGYRFPDHVLENVAAELAEDEE